MTSSTGAAPSSSTSFDRFAATRTFGSLDGLRAISIVGVVLFHASRGNGAYWLTAPGYHGVGLFFAISGFLITTLLLRERDRRGDISLVDFYIRRSLRIFPLYYTVLAIYAVVTIGLEKDLAVRAAFIDNLKWFLSYTSNWFVGHGEGGGRVIFYFAWSLATEEQFYLAWPSVVRFAGRAHFLVPPALALVMVGLWMAAVHAWLPPSTPAFVDVLLRSVPPSICLGTVAAHLMHRRASFDVMNRVFGFRGASIAWSLIATIVIYQDHLQWFTPPPVLFDVVFAAFVVSCVIREDHLLAPLLAWRPMRSIGQVSYGIYLLHMMVLNVIEKIVLRVWPAAQPVAMVTTVFAAWGVAWLSFTLYESRFLRWKERFAR